jgi:trehalose/maltose hydrolase-like predicted phosphorylase
VAQKYVVQLIDDLDQEPIEEGAGESVFFALDGVNYAIDLSSAHADALRSTLSRYVEAGRKAQTGARSKAYSAATRAGKIDLKEVRAWASQHGYKVSSRGRIPADIQAAFANR